MLDLPRVASTQPYCYAHSYVYIVTGAGRSSVTPEGKATFSRDWDGPEAHLVYSPKKQTVRNESGTPFREVIIETSRPVQFDPLQGSYDTDLFPSDLGSVKPTWTVSFTLGALTVYKTQMAPGDQGSFGSLNHLLIALADISLQRSGDSSDKKIEMKAQEVRVLPGGLEFKLINDASAPAQYISVEF